MKLINRNTDYAVRAIRAIASSSREILTVTELMVKIDMPRPFLRKILQKLNKAGILESCKGKGGGFRLVLTPREISLLDVMEVFQGTFGMTEHVFLGDICPGIEGCILKKRLDDLENIIVKELRSITIDALL